MVWRVTKVEEQRKEFINKYCENQESVAVLCREFNISRKTAYKWLNRYQQEGEYGLKDRSRTPHSQTQKTTAEVINLIVSLKHQKKPWGPKKIRAKLEKEWPSIKFPSTTTIGKILENQGLTIPRKYRKRYPAKTEPLSHCKKPNDIWCIDFKGWFKTKDSIKCEPLTITDAYSRYILYCSKLPMTTGDHVWDVLQKVFEKYGLPTYLRHDNGPPFATVGTGRLSRLSIRLIKAGIIPEWIDPGKPYQNGRHERMHLTLQQEGVFPLELTLKEQQLKFVEFLKYFNYERPHEGLGQRTPGSVYIPSERQWTGKLQTPEYSSEYQVRRLRGSGQLAWYGKDIQIGKTLANEYVGIKENDEGEWSICFGPVYLGTINHEKQFIQPKVRSIRNENHCCKVY
jgi:putative transposase